MLGDHDGRTARKLIEVLDTAIKRKLITILNKSSFSSLLSHRSTKVCKHFLINNCHASLLRVIGYLNFCCKQTQRKNKVIMLALLLLT